MRAVTARKLTSGSKAKPPQSNEAAATLTSQQESCLQTDARRRSCSVHLRTMLYGACCVRRHRSDRTCLPAPRYGLRSRFSCQSCSPRPNGHQSDNGQARDAGHHDGIVLGCIHCCLPNCCQLLGHCYAGEIAGLGAASIRRAATGLALCVRPLIVTLIRMMMRFESFRAFSCDQKLFPHFSEAGAAIFTIEQV
jgi:hypothetical protein